MLLIWNDSIIHQKLPALFIFDPHDYRGALIGVDHSDWD